MATVTLKHVYKIYENSEKGLPSSRPAVSDFCMEIQDKEFIVFVGPSGCGKSTTLRMIAGLEEISQGEIWIDDKVVNDVAPKDRDIAMVFQSYALYPQMTVYDNMAFSLKLRKIPDIKKDKAGNPVLDENGNTIPVMRKYTQAEIDEKVRGAAKILAIEEYLERKPKALSGGQRQRVALGRTIVRNPKVFLLD
ncbi:MAG: ATP-binding cassette domain-containing protein, partial [Clostridia bacterium]|nr:ATP-binding cassette domain-containing protein [Clostridia bacterium]